MNERLVVCRMLHDEVDRVRREVRLDDLSAWPLRLVYEAAVALRDAGHPATPDAVLDWLQRNGRAADLGPNPALFIADLTDADPTGANLNYAAEQVREAARRRDLLALVRQLERDAAANVEPAADLATRFGTQLAELVKDRGRGGRRAADALPRVRFAEVAPVLDTADFVEGLLIDGAMSVVYGESGCGKTFFTLDLALHVAAGWPWRDRQVERRGVLYLALEGGGGVRNRIAAFRERYGVEDIPFEVVPVQVNLLDPAADTDRVIEAATRAAEGLGLPVGLVVVDTLSRALSGGNENSPDDMGSLVRNLDRIRQALPSHVLVIHHSGKDTAKGARGHSLLRAATDTELEVTPDGSGVSTARVTKQRDLPREGEFAFKLEPIHLGVNRRGKPVTSCVVVEAVAAAPDPRAALTGDQKAALNVLTDLVEARGKTGELGVPHGTRSVPFEDWREGFYSRVKPRSNSEARKKAFQRVTEKLIDDEIVFVREPNVWVADDAGQTGQTGLCPAVSRDNRDTGL